MTTASHTVEPRYIDGPGCRLFVMVYRPQANDRGELVLFSPPFAEEMNRSRPMVSHCARRLAADGYTVVVPDLTGCGDSFGSLEDATVDAWIEDLAAVQADALDAYSSVTRTSVWGLRFGALLALVAASRGRVQSDRFVWWSPVLDGAGFAKQFLRLKTAASMIGKTDRRETVAGLVESLERGDSVEVGGYAFSASMYRSMLALSLPDLASGVRQPLAWFELTASAAAPLPMPVKNAQANYSGAGEPSYASLVGPKFWSTAEIAMVPELSAATGDYLAGRR